MHEGAQSKFILPPDTLASTGSFKLKHVILYTQRPVSNLPMFRQFQMP